MDLLDFFGKRYVFLLDLKSNLCLYKVDERGEKWELPNQTPSWKICRPAKVTGRQHIFEVLGYDMNTNDWS